MIAGVELMIAPRAHLLGLPFPSLPRMKSTTWAVTPQLPQIVLRTPRFAVSIGTRTLAGFPSWLGSHV